MPPPDLLSSIQAAALLRVSQRTIHRLVSDGTLSPYLTGPGGPHGAFMFQRDDVERIAQQRQDANQAASA